jgi:hypothetical protein
MLTLCAQHPNVRCYCCYYCLPLLLLLLHSRAAGSSRRLAKRAATVSRHDRLSLRLSAALPEVMAVGQRMLGASF